MNAKKKSGFRSLGGLVLLLFTLIAVYVLSFGPVGVASDSLIPQVFRHNATGS